MNKKYILINLVTSCIVYMIFYVVINSLWKAGVVYSIFILLISTINYYTINYHGTPLTFSEIKNFRTALNVIGGYHFNFREVIDMLIFFLIEIMLCCIIRGLYVRKNKENKKDKISKTLAKRGGICFVAFLIFFVIYLSPNPLMTNSLVWQWRESYSLYGYLACTMSEMVASFNYLSRPEGYQKEWVNGVKIETPMNKNAQGELPDVFLILNESLYDLSLIADIKTDIPYLQNINNMDNTVRGYVVVPRVGGGTNASEYELLTSNSMQLMPGTTPFNVIDMSEANTIVSHLKQLNYYTISGHPAMAINYNRGKCFADMGFDRSFFEDEFEDKSFFADRVYCTDECLYNNVLQWMEEYGERPYFTYLLTLQNHGSWDMNGSDMDIIHTMNDFGDYNELINEYLSCVSLSDNAFKELTEQLKEIDRKIVVCMVGDHCPGFARYIVDEKLKLDSELLLRCTPFVIWANYDIMDMDMGIISLNYLVPTLFEIAGINLSPYYQYMLNLKDNIPILTSYGVYYDKYMLEYLYDSDSEYAEDINAYFYLEYNNLQKDRRQVLFDVY